MNDSDNQTTDPQGDQDNSQQVEDASDANPLQLEVDELKQALEQQKHQHLLTRADFENYRRNVDKEKAKFGAIANMQLVTQILEVIDDIQLALQDEGLTKDRAEEMLKIAQDKLGTAVLIAGLEKIEVKVGDVYQASKMEAITTAPVESEDKHNTVVAVISAGYQYSGQGDILKTAKVVVGKHSGEAK